MPFSCAFMYAASSAVWHTTRRLDTEGAYTASYLYWLICVFTVYTDTEAAYTARRQQLPYISPYNTEGAYTARRHHAAPLISSRQRRRHHAYTARRHHAAPKHRGQRRGNIEGSAEVT